MKKILLRTGIIATIFFTACGENAHEDTPKITLPVASNAADSAKPTITTNQLTLPSMPQPYRNSNTKTALNPAHGQLGHRCDIAVGDPLNSPTQQTQQPMPATQMIPATPSPATNANGTVRLNPAHGQFGHRCDIAVGDPLNSPTQQTQQPMSATQMIPVTPSPATNANGTVRLNPAHGQPGHDCSIVVGQPLK